LQNEYLIKHKNLNNLEFYLCGPPVMVQAANNMLAELGVNQEQIAYDEF
jgi:Na+-transporting NADH:ubiquinone oxidoreductase subunit F